MIDEQADIALQADRRREIRARWQADGAAAALVRRGDRPVDRLAIKGRAIAFRTSNALVDCPATIAPASAAMIAAVRGSVPITVFMPIPFRRDSDVRRVRRRGS